MTKTRNIAVFGAMSTNEIIYVDKTVGVNEVIYTNNSMYIAGGKALNIAGMIKTLSPDSKITFCSKTARDIHGLWKYPVDWLKKYGVDTSLVIVEESKDNPNRVIAQIERQTGNKSYIVISGVTESYSPADITFQEKVFDSLSNGAVVTTLEIPTETALTIMKKATLKKIPLFVDLGGVMPNFPLERLFDQDIFLLKPNRYETEILTGEKVTDLKSAQSAGRRLLKGGVKNVLITAGENGAYLINKDIYVKHFPVPRLRLVSDIRNAAGCGDQVMANLCYGYLQNLGIIENVKRSILAGTKQLYKDGIMPLLRDEIC